MPTEKTVTKETTTKRDEPRNAPRTTETRETKTTTERRVEPEPHVIEETTVVEEEDD